MKRIGMLLFLLVPAQCAFAQSNIEIRFFDPYSLRSYAHFKPGRMPLFLQFYTGAWHGIAYYDEERKHKLFTGEFADRQAGVRNGQFVMYRLDGSKALALRFSNNAVDGPLYEFDDSGKMQCVKTYSDGMLHGPSKLYRPDGSMVAIQFWTYNRIDSSCWYHPNEKLARQIIFRKKAVARERCFDVTGASRSCDAFKSRDAVVPAVFKNTMTAAVRALARAEGLLDTTLFLTVTVKETGQYTLESLSRVQNPVLIEANSFFNVQNFMMRLLPAPDIAANPDLRKRLQDQLDAVPRAIPAYVQSVAVTSTHAIAIRLD